MASNPEFRRTVLIGLGGSGQLVLVHLKRLFMDTYGVIPPAIKLLALDTDSHRASLRSQVNASDCTLDAEEFLYMRVEEPVKFIEGSGTVGEWYVKPVPVGAIDSGTGAIRQNGRLAFYFYLNEFQRRIDRVTAQLTAGSLAQQMEKAKDELGAKSDFALSERRPEVYVCGSLAGGTGSGTFLDVAILLRDAMPNALIHGFFLLNWIYRNKAFAYRVGGNTYAALAELDNLQSIMYGTAGFVPYRVIYGDKKIAVENAPYSLFHLIDGRNEYGENIDDVDQLCETVATAIFLSVSSMGDPVTSAVDNLLAHVHVQPPRIWKGRHARYSSLGVSSIYYPARELHRLVSLLAAVKLCQQAIAEVKQPAAGGKAEAPESIEQAVMAFFDHHHLTRDNIRKNVCPARLDIDFQAEDDEIADPDFPSLLRQHLHEADAELERGMQKAFQDKGAGFIETSQAAFQQKLAELQADTRLDAAYRHQWITQAVRTLTGWSAETDQDSKATAEEETQDIQNAENLLEVARKSRYIPLIGGWRKSRVMEWVDIILARLRKTKTGKEFEYERKFYDALLEMLGEKAKMAVPGVSEIQRALAETEGALRARYAAEEESFQARRASRPTEITVGSGSIVVVRSGQKTRDSFELDYADFKKASKIDRVEQFLLLYQEGREKLLALFLDYALNYYREVENVPDVGVEEAMETIGEREGDKDKYIEKQVDRLFRLSAAMWSFRRGMMNEIQRPHYDKIINLGVFEQGQGRRKLKRFVEAAKDKYNIGADHTFSTTGDKYQIMLLSYAAALPIYFLRDVELSKQRYEEEITPTYHIDRYFEMNVPDLFPVDDMDNRVLRVLGMAIVPGIDVIHDEKLPKGHKFTLDAPELRAVNFGEPKVWLLFRDMYAEIKKCARSQGSDNLLDIIIKLLKAKVNSMSQGELRRFISEYVQRVSWRLERRDFSRLISARLTYREVKELEAFLSHPPNGYDMDIDRYISGS